MLMRLMSKGEYLIVPKGTKFTGSGKLGLNQTLSTLRKGHDLTACFMFSRFEVLFSGRGKIYG